MSVPALKTKLQTAKQIAAIQIDNVKTKLLDVVFLCGSGIPLSGFEAVFSMCTEG